MDRIKTKFIVAVTDMLSGAPDTDAKLDLIEEVSENLYQRYLEFSASGMGEGEAFGRALEELGDADELRRILNIDGFDSPSSGGRPQGGGRARPGGFDFEGPWQQSDFGQNIDDLVRSAMSMANVAVLKSKEYAEEIAARIREKYPNGFQFRKDAKVHIHFDDDHGEHPYGADHEWEDADFTDLDDELDDLEDEFDEDASTVMELSADGARRVSIRAFSADVTVRVLDVDEDRIIVMGEGGDFIVRCSDGTFTVEQTGPNAEALEVVLPGRSWEAVRICTSSGDALIDGTLDTGELFIKSTSGDLRIPACAGSIRAESTSGDVTLRGQFGAVSASSTSGDVTLAGAFGSLSASSTSGDVRLRAENLDSAQISTSSGDVTLDLAAPPEYLKVHTRSGDCNLRLPEDQGFDLDFGTANGSLRTNFLLERNGGCLRYLDGGNSRLEVATSSGDFTLRRKRPYSQSTSK